MGISRSQALLQDNLNLLWYESWHRIICMGLRGNGLNGIIRHTDTKTILEHRI